MSEELNTNEESKKTWSFEDSATYKNANFVLEQIKKSTLSPLNLQPENINGQHGLSKKPLPVTDLFSGRLLNGTNQIIAQDILNSAKITDPEVFTYTEGKDYGIIPKKGSPYIVITTKNKDGKYNDYRYFPVEFATDFSEGKIAAVKYSRRLDRKIEALRNHIAREKEDEKANILLTQLAYTHRDNMYGKACLKTSLKPEEKAAIVSNYVKNLPENEKKLLDEKIFIKVVTKDGKEFDNSTHEGFIKNFNENLFCANAKKELDKINEALSKREPIVIDARNCPTANAYLGKYLAATTFAKDNPNVTFITDKSSVDAVKNDMTVTLEKAFSENRHTEAFNIGNSASELCKDEIKQFREQQIAAKSPKEQSRTLNEQAIEMVF